MNEIKWSKIEKKIAREIFDKAYNRECAEIIKTIRKKALKLNEPNDIWQLNDFLYQRRKEIDDKYDFRYSVLFFVFARLIKEGWLSIEDLEGIEEDKISKIAAILSF